jgi:hypothetical protein
VVRDRGGGGRTLSRVRRRAAILHRPEHYMFGFGNMRDVVWGTFYRHTEAKGS